MWFETFPYIYFFYSIYIFIYFFVNSETLLDSQVID